MLPLKNYAKEEISPIPIKYQKYSQFPEDILDNEKIIIARTKESILSNEKSSQTEDLYSLYFDGSYRPVHKVGSCGWIIKNSLGITLDTGGQFYPENITSNLAEYNGVLQGLLALKKNKINLVKIFGDSKLVIEQLRGNWRINNKALKTKWEQAKKLLSELEYYELIHIKREFNSEADQISNSFVTKK